MFAGRKSPVPMGPATDNCAGVFLGKSLCRGCGGFRSCSSSRGKSCIATSGIAAALALQVEQVEKRAPLTVHFTPMKLGPRGEREREEGRDSRCIIIMSRILFPLFITCRDLRLPGNEFHAKATIVI
jgi:hypothetical protein